MYKIYVRENCPICDQAESKLIDHKVEYKEIVIGVDITRDEVIKQFPNATIAPIIVSPDGYEIPVQYLDMILVLAERMQKNG
jgi:glutaredoxin